MGDLWFVTQSGKKIFPRHPHPDLVDIEDIAHSLSNICRYGGHSLQFYSVAQHSVLVSNIVHHGLALEGLLHDAAEAYVGDVIRPLKKQLSDYKEIEEGWEQAVAAKFDLQWPGDRTAVHEVKRADLVALVTERQTLVNKAIHTDDFGWVEDEKGIKPLAEKVVALTPWEARELFCTRYTELTGTFIAWSGIVA